MRFFVRKRKQSPTVIIVALIDVLIVLVIFLIVTTTFKHQPALKLALPESTSAVKGGASESAPLIVTIDEKGTILLGHDKHPYTAEEIKVKLQAEAQKNPELKLAINADTKAPFGQIVKIMDAAKAAKIKMVNAFTKEAKP